MKNTLSLLPSILALSGAAALAAPLAADTETCLQALYAASTFDAGPGASGVAAGDLDRDGDLDVVVAQPEAFALQVLVNNGRGGFQPFFVDVGPGPAQVAMGDTDGDGDLDVLLALMGQMVTIGYEGAGMRVLVNDGSGNMAAGALQPFQGKDGEPTAAFLADVDGDARVDALIGLGYHPFGVSATGALALARGDGAGGFGPFETHALPMSAGAMRMADLDGDAHQDVAWIGGYFGSPQVRVTLGQGDGTWAELPTGFPAGNYAGALEAGDWDGDGDVDLATGDKYDVTPYFNDGAASFAAGTSAAIGSYVKGLACGDVDRDGDLDLAGTSGGAAALRILRNDGTGRFVPGAAIPAGSQAYAVMLADTSGDGFLDPWSIDVISGKLVYGASDCIVGRYGKAKPSSLGCLPQAGASGSPSISGAGFTLFAEHELILQPALVVVGFAPDESPFLGSVLLVQGPWIFLPAASSFGSGDPAVCDGVVVLPASAAQLAALGAGTELYTQVFGLDPFQTDGTFASLSDGLRFKVIP